MEWKNYIVGLVDISGQSSKLDELGSLLWELQGTQNTAKEKFNRATELTKETYEVIEYFRELFIVSFNNMKDITLKHPKITTLSAAEQTEIKKIANDLCTLRFFSDLVLFYTPFDAENELLTRFRIAAMLYACTCVSIIEFKYGNFFRGGIEIGAGAELSNHDLYGPVLNESHRLEKQVANYPRIVAGKKLSHFIQIKKQVVNSRKYLDSVLARIDDFCKKMIYQDDDGEFAVDYLGKGIADLSQSSYNQTSDSVKKGIAKIEAQLSLHRKNPEQNLVNRFERLLAYYQSRKTFWDK